MNYVLDQDLDNYLCGKNKRHHGKWQMHNIYQDIGHMDEPWTSYPNKVTLWTYVAAMELYNEYNIHSGCCNSTTTPPHLPI